MVRTLLGAGLVRQLTTYVGSAGSMIGGLTAQLFAFVVLARHLGPSQFGVLMTITAVTGFTLTLCGLGGGDTMVRRLARQRSLYPALLGHNLMLIGLSGTVLTVAVTAILAWAEKVSPAASANVFDFALFTFSSVVLYRWIVLAEQVFLGLGQFTRANLVNGGFAAARAATAVVACFGFGVSDLATWIYWHSAVHAVGSLACVVALAKQPRPEWRFVPGEIGLGIHACTPTVFDTLRQNIDRLVLSAIAPAEVVGIYGAATRFVQTSVVTIIAMGRVLYPLLSARGGDGLAAVVRLIARFLPMLLGIAAATTVAMYLCAGLLGLLFGEAYRDIVPYVRIMVWLLPLVAITNAAYDALGAADRHAVRAHIFNANAILATGLVALLTWRGGVYGAFAAMFVSQTLIAISLWLAVGVMVRKGRDGPPMPACDLSGGSLVR